jgi:hypothetical protein
MIFPSLDLEPVIQVGDRTRLSALKSFVTNDEAAIDLVMIQPGASASFITVDVTDRYLDYSFSASGTYVITARVGASGASADLSSSISVITAASDALFSTDADLKLHEPDILQWTSPGRNSFLNIHRRAQKLIIEELRREGYTDTSGDPYTKAAIVDVEEVKQWSTMWTLQLIFEGLSNATDDVFHEKAVRYSALRQTWGKTALLRLDTDGSGTIDDGEGIDTASAFVGRR